MSCGKQSRLRSQTKRGAQRTVESRGWIRFIVIAELLPENRIGVLLNGCDQLCRILGKSVATVKGKNRQQRGDIADRDDN